MTIRGRFVCPGGPADGRLVPGDQLVKINDIAVDDLTPEQAAEIIRLSLINVFSSQGPKSSFITPEKRAKLRSNPVKVHFAEEVEVNGQSQGNSLLFLPNVLKVYLENGQTKAFKFEISTTVKDIVMTLKEKLSLNRIEHFSLVLEQQHNSSRLLLLHDEERIHQVVQKKEVHNYRCLFRVCFLPKDFKALLQEDPAAFEYLYLQGVNDVLQERYAVEMRCNAALRLAALHIQERLVSSGQSPKANLKMITKTWGIENFVSSTLLRNMREKDLRKAISFHLKKTQSHQDPRQKALSVEQARINYLEELSDLKSFGGKSFGATLMLQDRESMVSLLVGARYGVSQVVNHKLSIMTTLTEFNSITRVELLPESDKVSLVKIYLQDIKPITLLLEASAAKDMSCLIAGYCRVFIDPNLNVFPWMDDKKHRVSAEEGTLSLCSIEKQDMVEVQRHDSKIQIQITDSSEGQKINPGTGEEEQPTVSEASDSCHTDSRVLSSPSSDSLDALEEDDLISCSSSSVQTHARSQAHVCTHSPIQLHFHSDDDLQRKAKLQCGISGTLRTDDRRGVQGHPLSTSPSSPSSHKDFFFNFDQSDARCYYNLCSNITPDSAHNLPGPQHPNSGGSHKTEVKTADPEPVPILQPPPGFGDSSSDDEFFDARDRFTSPEDPTSGAVPRGDLTSGTHPFSVMDINKDKGAEMDKQKEEEERGSKETMFLLRKRSRKRRSFMETDYTSQVTYPESDLDSESNLNSCSDNTILTSDPEPSEQTQNPSLTVSSLTHAEGEPAQLESKPILSKLHSHGPGFLSASEQTRNLKPPSRTRKQEMEMEPDAMESKSVTDLVKVVPPTITVVRCRVDPDGKESADRRGDGKEEGEDQEEMSGRKGESKEEKPACLTGNGPFTTHMFLPDIIEEEEKDDVKKEKMFQLSSSLKRPLVGAEISQDATLIPNSLTEVNKNVVTTQINTHVDKHFPTFITSPPPPPPSRLLPQTPTGLKLDCETLVKEAELHKTIETSIKLSALNLKEEISCHSDTAQSIKQTLVSINDEELIGIQESTESSNSDNVFEDEDDAHTSFSPNCTSDEHQYDRTVSANSSLTQGTTDKLHIDAQLHLNCEEQIRGLNADHILAIKSIRAKLEATTNIISSLNSGTELKNMGISKPKSDSSLVGGATADSSGSPSIVIPKAATLSDLSKDLTPPARFLFQTYSPSIMGRLSASTLRGKIQNLPLYLSRSQESLTQAGVESSAQSPAKEACRNEAYPLDGFHDITQTFDLEMGLAPDSAESDDSDATLTGSELDGEFFLETASAQRSPLTPEKKEVSFELPVQTEPKQHHQTLYAGPNDNTPGPVTEPPTSIIHFFQRDSSGLNAHMPGPIKDAPELNIRVNNLPEDIPGYKDSSQSPIVVTTQNLNGPQLAFYGQSQKVRRTSNDRPLMGLCRPLEQISDPSKVPSTSCKVFTICEDLSQKSPSSDLVSATPLKAEFGCSSLFASGCESVAEGVQVPLDACGCPASYTNCFSGEESFDDEGGLHLITSPTAPSFISTSSTLSPSYPNPILLSTSTSELSPLLSPPSESSNSYLSQAHKDTLRHLGQQHYPEPPEGFQVLRRDVDKLLTILEGSNSSDRSVEGLGGRHPRDTCPAHFTENKRVLQLEARRLMSGCQKVAGTGQSPDEMLKFLADSFQTLVELASVCLWFSGCDRCDRRNAEAWAGLADVARSFRDFCLAAERASSKRSCQDLSTKLLAKQCTALTASVFCLTQLFRTLTAL
uniref:FERM and PDZ domain-containing protein 1-like n=1 Tax=Cyprinodon variegatus TaxID=28743 RepID=A0A3Q2G864_CYPVA